MSRRAKGWVVMVEGARYGVLARSASEALTLTRAYCPREQLSTRGPLPADYVRGMKHRRSVLVNLKSLSDEALNRGVALRKFRAQTSSRNFDKPTSKELTMKKATKQAKSTKVAKSNGESRADAKYKVNKSSDYAVREGTMSDKFVQALPKGVFTKTQAVSATQKAVKTEKRASTFFNYFKGKGVIATA